MATFEGSTLLMTRTKAWNVRRLKSDLSSVRHKAVQQVGGIHYFFLARETQKGVFIMVPFKMYLCKSLVESPRAVKYLILTWISIYWEPPLGSQAPSSPNPLTSLVHVDSEEPALSRSREAPKESSSWWRLGSIPCSYISIQNYPSGIAKGFRIRIAKVFRIGITKELRSGLPKN